MKEKKWFIFIEGLEDSDFVKMGHLYKRLRRRKRKMGARTKHERERVSERERERKGEGQDNWSMRTCFFANCSLPVLRMIVLGG